LDLLPSLIRNSESEIESCGILEFWFSTCSKQSENDGKHSLEERIVSLTLISELWFSFPAYVLERKELQETILKQYKKACRDRNKMIRTTAISIVFSLLDTFSEEKNPVAPMMLKTLILSLVEDPHDTSIRQHYYYNFRELFET